MSKAGERLMRSVQEAVEFVENKGENTKCTVIPNDMTEEELTRLLEEKFGADSEEEPTEAEQPETNHSTQPGSAIRPAQQRNVAAASRKR